MTMQNYFVVTNDQRDAILALNTSAEVMLSPVAITRPAPGVGINLSEEAIGVEPGEVVTLVDKSIVPQIAMHDPDYIAHLPDSVAYLRTLPWCSLQDETIFAPPPVVI